MNERVSSIPDYLADEVFSRGCQHPEGCSEVRRRKLTIDHFTPKCIAKIWGWTPAELNSRENLQALCVPHHNLKDKDTEKRKSVLAQQLQGEVLLFRSHRKQFK